MSRSDSDLIKKESLQGQLVKDLEIILALRRALNPMTDVLVRERKGRFGHRETLRERVM